MAVGRRSMVCRRMGLLDDAIREHLELKRLRGADPGFLAREEHEAFGPVRGGDAPANADDGGAPDDFDEPAGEDVMWMDDDHVPVSRLDDAQENDAHMDDAQDFSSVGQETAELDMRSVLEEDAGHDQTPVDDRSHVPIDGLAPADGRGPVDGHDPTAVGRGDDALEETSDLPHDVPEQEQLFEQRPARDFGLDE